MIFFSGEEPCLLHHTPLPSTPTAPFPLFTEILNTPLPSCCSNTKNFNPVRYNASVDQPQNDNDVVDPGVRRSSALLYASIVKENCVQGQRADRDNVHMYINHQDEADGAVMYSQLDAAHDAANDDVCVVNSNIYANV